MMGGWVPERGSTGSVLDYFEPLVRSWRDGDHPWRFPRGTGGKLRRPGRNSYPVVTGRRSGWGGRGGLASAVLQQSVRLPAGGFFFGGFASGGVVEGCAW